MDVQRHEGGVWRLIATVIILLVLGTASAPGQSENLDALNAQVIQLYRTGKYAQAVPIARKYADGIKKKFGDTHPKYATALIYLATLYRVQGRYGQASYLDGTFTRASPSSTTISPTLHAQASRTRVFSGTSSSTVTVTSTVSPILTGARKCND